jgi:nucleotide-binding universal stress UspA family protein
MVLEGVNLARQAFQAGEGDGADLAVFEGDGVAGVVLGADAADLLVVGSRGLTGVKAAALGSVSQAVAQLAPCPVLIVKT